MNAQKNDERCNDNITNITKIKKNIGKVKTVTEKDAKSLNLLYNKAMEEYDNFFENYPCEKYIENKIEKK